MGWHKNLYYAEGGAIALGNWRARHNALVGAIDLIHPSAGVSYVWEDEDFAEGEHDYTEVDKGAVALVYYPGWDEATSRDAEALLDLEHTFDLGASASLFFDYLFDATSHPVAYGGGGVYTSPSIVLTPVGYLHESAIEWMEDTLPQGGVITVETSIYHNGEWSPWDEAANETAIAALPPAGRDLSANVYRLRCRVTLQRGDDGTSPELSDLIVKLVSQRHFRITSTGDYFQSPYMRDSVVTQTDLALEAEE